MPQRGNIDYDQIRLSARQGNGTKIQMSAGADPIAGNIAIFGQGGNIVDGGPPPSGAVSSVFGRTGAVTAQAGDYTAAKVTNAVDTTQQYANPSWIASLAWSKITGAPSAGFYQTPWLQNIDGASFNLNKVGAIGIGMNSVVTFAIRALMDSVGNSIAHFENPNPTGAGGFLVKNDGNHSGNVMCAGSTYPNANWRNNTVVNAGGTTDSLILATNSVGRVTVSSGGAVGIGNDASVLPMGASTAVQLIVGDTTAASAKTAMITLATNNPSGAAMGLISWANYNLAGTDKRIASIHGAIGQTPDSGDMIFYTWNAGVVAERMRIAYNGAVSIPGAVGIGIQQSTWPLMVREGADKCIVFTPVGGGIPAAIQVTNDAGNTYVPMEYAASKHVFSQGAVGLNTQTVPDQLTIYTGNPQVCRMAGVGRGAIWYNDNAAFYLLVTNNGDPLGAYNSLRPFSIDFASGAVGMRHGLSVGAGPAANNGDFVVARNDSPNTGVVFFGNTSTKYLYQDGTNFQLAIPGGIMLINGASVNTTPSDIRIKRNVRDLAGGLPLIEKLRPKEFEFNGLGGTQTGKRSVSLIAQELQEASSSAVEIYRTKLHAEDAEETELLAYNPHEITMHLILAVQQLQKALEA